MNASQKRKSEYQKMRSAFESLDWPVPTPQSVPPLDPRPPGRSPGHGPRSGTGPRFHGADAGSLLPSPDQPRTAERVCPAEWTLHAGDECGRTQQASLREPSPALVGLGLDGGRENPEANAGTRE